MFLYLSMITVKTYASDNSLRFKERMTQNLSKSTAFSRVPWGFLRRLGRLPKVSIRTQIRTLPIKKLLPAD